MVVYEALILLAIIYVIICAWLGYKAYHWGRKQRVSNPTEEDVKEAQRQAAEASEYAQELYTEWSRNK